MYGAIELTLTRPLNVHYTCTLTPPTERTLYMYINPAH